MKLKTVILLSAMMIIALSACKKNREPEVKPDQPVKTGFINVENKDYPIIKIGQQTWTTVNHAGNGGVAFDNANSHPEYGKYYTFDEARQIPLPAGWRLPTMPDYVKLAESMGVVFNADQNNTDALKKLTSKTQWNHISGNNAFGFNAFPAGYIFQNQMPQGGDIAEFWTLDGRTFSIQENGNQTGLRAVFYTNNTTGYRFPVRFVKND
jgi:uncharacterized protein (TIGR02145 family)